MNTNQIHKVDMASTYVFEAFTRPAHISAPDWDLLSGEEKVAQGDLKWVDKNHNIVVDEGLNDLLDKYFKGSTYTAAHYVGLMASSPTPAAGDTMASHAGWVEVTAYSEANRQTLTLGTVASKSVDNSASKAIFNINADTTGLGGAFTTTNNTKGGTTGTLYGASAFSAGNKSLDNGDVLQVTVTLTSASA